MKDPRYPYALDIGTEVAGYRILDILGAGGFGITYKAFNDVTHKTVAIKEFYIRDISSRTGSTVVVDTAVSEGTYEYALQKFQEEAKSVVNRFQHRYIVRGENFIRWNNTCYLVMEYVEGVNFEQWLNARTEPPTEADLRHVMEKVFEAVDYVHERNTMHRDLTPRNIMIRPSGDPLLIDFGAAGQGIDRDRSSKMVAQMRYAPPEQTDADGPGQHGRYTDIYSLGAVFYRAVSGAPPLASVTRIMRMGRRAGSGEDPYVPAAQAALMPARYSPRFLDGIDRALKLDERERPQTIQEFRAALGWATPDEIAALAERGGWTPSGDDPSRTIAIDGGFDRTAMIGRPQAQPPAPPQDRPSEARRPSRPIDLGRTTSERVSVVTGVGGGAKVVVADEPRGAGDAAPPPPEPGRKGGRTGLIAAALAAVLVIGAALFAFLRPGEDPGPAPGAYGMTASREGGTVRLAGFAPTETDRQAFQDVVARAVAGVQIANTIRIAEGAPPGYADIGRLSLGSLADLQTGTVRIVGRDVTIEGTAASPQGYKTLLRDYGRPLPGGWLSRVTIRPAAVDRFAFQIDLEPGRAVIGGYVPDEGTQLRILDAARRALPGQTVQDESQIASGADATFPDLAVFAAGKLAELSLGRLTIAGSELRVEGRARSPEAYAALKAAAAPSGRLVAAIRPPLVQPFDLALNVEPDAVAITGFVPNEDVKTDLAAAVARVARGRAVRDDTRIADGDPPDFQRAARFVIEQIPRLARGRLALSGRSVTMDGQVASPQDFMALTRALQSGGPDGLPAGFMIDRNTVGAPRISPYPWAATLGAGVVRLSGFVPSEAVRQEVVAAARAAVGTTPVEDEMLIGDGAPAGFAGMAKLALAQVPRLAGGKVATEDGTLAVEGTAANPDAYAAALRDLARPLPGGGTVRNGLRPATVAPFTFAAEIGQNRIRLAGHVPSEDVRATLLEQARRLTPGVAVLDQSLVAAGAPPGFPAASAYALQRLAEVADGRVALSGNELRLEGRSKSFDAFQQSLARNREPVPGDAVLQFEVRPPIAAPFEFAAAADGSALVLTGFVPSAEVKAELAAAAGAAARGRTLRDETRIADGAPAEFALAAKFLAEQGGRLARGRAALRDQTVSVDGQAAGSAEYDDLKRGASSVPGGFRTARWSVEPPRISPYLWSVTVAPGATRLGGYVPSDGVRREIVAGAAGAFGAGSARDEMAAGDGAPDGFSAMTRWALTQAARLSAGRIALEDGNVTIEGTAASPEAHAALLRDLARPGGGAGIQRVALVPATVTPFTFAAEIAGSRLKLSGYVPGDDVRTQLLDTVRRGTPGLSVVDDLKLARGAAPGFAEMAAYGVARIAELGDGRATIADVDLRIEGRAKTSEAYQAAMAAQRNPGPAGARLTFAVRPPLAQPFEWSVGVETGGVTVSGAVPSEELRRELVQAVQQGFRDRPVKDETRIADGAPAEFAAAARLALDQAPRLARGRISLSDRSITIDGQSAGPEAYEQIRKATANGSVPNGFRIARFSVNAPVISPYTWQLTKAGAEVRLSGFMPNDATRRELVAAAGQVPGWKIADELQVGDGAPDRFLDTVRLAVAQGPRLDNGSVSIRDGSVVLEGVAATPESYAAILQDLGGALPGGGRARLDVKPATVAPFTWSAKIERGIVRLTGYVPTDEDRRRLAETIKAALPRGTDLRDDTRIAAGAGAGFAEAAQFAVGRIPELSEGTLTIADQALRVAGTARNADSFKSFSEAVQLAALPPGFALDHAVEPPRSLEPSRPPAPERPAAPERPVTPSEPRPDRPVADDPETPKPTRPRRTQPERPAEPRPERPTVIERPAPQPVRPRPPTVTERPAAPAAQRPSVPVPLSNCAASRC